jgi:hypothetical protein
MMNKIVREDYPATKLPEDLREGLDPAAQVRVTIEVVSQSDGKRPMSLDEIFALRRPPFRSAEEIDRELREERDSWDD